MWDERETFAEPTPSRAAGRRGQAALAKLPTTDAFTSAQLRPDDRKLILFLLVVLVDRYDRLTGLYQAVVDEYGDVPDHWAHGRDIGDLQKACSKFLGRGAARRPRWEVIVDLLDVGVSDVNRETIKAFAAGLYCRAATLSRPGGGYPGRIELPEWADQPVVTAAEIRDHLLTSTVAAPAMPVQRRSTDEIARLEHERDQQRHLAVAMAAELAVLRSADRVLRREQADLRRQNAALFEVATRYARDLHPVARPDDLRRRVVTDLNAVIGRLLDAARQAGGAH